MNYFEKLEDNKVKEKIDKIIQEIKQLAEKSNKKTGFTIANTKKHSKEIDLFFPPIRNTTWIVCGNVIVYQEEQASEIARYIDGKVDYILVDAEKKILPSEYGLNDAGNIELAVFLSARRSKILTFKSNDLTVNAIDTLIANSYSPLGGRRVAIIGAGNIGTKIALTLLERGARVNLWRRNKEKLKSIVEALNVIKPEGTISIAEQSKSLEYACRNCDIIIGSTPGIPCISKECIDVMKENGMIIDVGKGSILEEAISYAKEKNVKVIRADIRAGFEGAITTIFSTKELTENKLGATEIEGIRIASGGTMAEEGTVIVDNYKKPTLVIGVSNGKGDFKTELTKEESLNLSKIERVINNKSQTV